MVGLQHGSDAPLVETAAVIPPTSLPPKNSSSIYLLLYLPGCFFSFAYVAGEGELVVGRARARWWQKGLVTGSRLPRSIRIGRSVCATSNLEESRGNILRPSFERARAKHSQEAFVVANVLELKL